MGQITTPVKYSKGFLRFWLVYPRRKHKQDAMRAWKVFGCEAMSDEIIQAVVLQIEHSWCGRDREFIPYPATWIRACGWEDEVVDTKPQALTREQMQQRGLLN
jgi:hypothetical protein